ncbi:MAG: hypothetical protein R3F48_00245 [Candidatus Zixiibacteriota bacterium]
MKRFGPSLFFVSLICFLPVMCVQSNESSIASEDEYLGQRPPGKSPEIFAPGIVSDSGWAEHCQIAISPIGNEIYWSAWTSAYPNKNGDNTEQIFYSEYRQGAWTKPAIPQFINNHLDNINGGPVFSPDGNRLYFYSVDRPGGLGDMDTWFVEKVDGVWSDPVNAGDVYNSQGIDWTPTFTQTGFAYRNFDCLLKYSIVDGKFLEPDTITISDQYIPKFPVYISPDESYLIFTEIKEDSFGGMDLYISFKNDSGAWDTPVNMGPAINTELHERFPVLSPDGKYLFFVRHTKPDQDIFWVSGDIINEIRAKNQQ